MMMCNSILKTDRPLEQLGLPPMELAETANERRSRCLYWCLYPTLQKIFILLSLVTFSTGTYILLLKLLESTDTTHGTEIIVVTGLRETPNITLHQSNMDIYFQLKNYTSDMSMKRKKRHVMNPSNKTEILNNLGDDDLQKVKDIIMKHRTLCHEEKHKDTCTELIKKLKSIIEYNEEAYNNSEIDTTKHLKGPETFDRVKFVPSDVSKREAHPLPKFGNFIGPAPVSTLESIPAHTLPHSNTGHTYQLTDTCLLAKLLKQNYPHVHGIYDAPTSEFVAPHIDQSHLPHLSYHQPSYLQSREIDNHRKKYHQQDIDIFMSFFTPKPDILIKQSQTNSSSPRMVCSTGSLPCANSDGCVEEKQWCDGNVECSDASDEIGCSCKSRVDRSRLCDGYFDCPFGEDEMGCFGCKDNTFSCGDIDTNSQSTCFTKDQRCNNVVDCSNHKDEIECNMLAPSLSKKPLFAISNIEGYLHRNLKGDWYAVCQNPYMWAHDACRRETGLIIRPPFIQILPIDPLLKVNYLNTGPGGLIQPSDTCFNSSAVYVTCPDFLCGTRIQTTSQFLRENMAVENRLFGRNKRFLHTSHRFNPYHMMYYGNRMKRDTTATDTSETIEEIDLEILKDDRKKRAESRVVGGRPSQPAAWPWMVAMYRDGMFHCGGVVFTRSWVISAAHCVHEFWDHHYEIQVGMLRRFSFSPQEQNHKVTHVIVNRHYNKADMKDDLSLLRVEPEIQFSRWVRPICLPGPNTAGSDWFWGPTPGTICTAVGWGATKEHGPDPDHMREVEVPVWEHCKHREDRAGKEICAGLAEGGKDACQGDSGGPLLCRNPLNSQQWYLAGIVSHGDGCARKNEPGVYTRVSLFVKWIKYHTSSKSLPLVQPIQECPGFKCQSGISKCLPNTRKCDKIVDCLDAEDESDCDFMRSSSDLQPKIANNITKIHRTSDKFSREVESKSLESTENIIDNLDIVTSLTDNVDVTTEKNSDRENKVTNNKSSMTDITIENTDYVTKALTNNLVTSSTTVPTDVNDFTTDSNKLLKESDHDNFEDNVPATSVDKLLDLTNASTTIEIIPTQSFGELGNDDDDIVTADPIAATSDELKTTSHEDLSTFTITFKPEILESRSSVMEDQKLEQSTDNVELRQTDGEENSTITESSLFTASSTPIIEELVRETTTQNVANIATNKGIQPQNELLDNDVSETKSKNKIENKSGGLLIELLPNSQSTTSSLDENLNQNEGNRIKDQNLSENNQITKNPSAKNLSDLEENIDNIQKIEDIVFSELQPASIRRKHRISKEFECRRIIQKIPHYQRCDHKADCEDGTDELDCSCIDFLSTFDEKLICDGVFDCADGQDEFDCYSCPEEHFLCKRSEICLPTKYVCDGKPQCPLGEDELNCYALSNGREMFYGSDNKPKINLEGYLTKRNRDDWQVVCEEKQTIEQQEEAANHICHYLGFSSVNRYYIKYINVKEEDIFRSGLDNTIRQKRAADKSIPVHFAFRDVGKENKTARNIVIKGPQVLKEECVPNITKTCKSLYVYCDRSLYTNFDLSQDLLYDRAVESSKGVTTHMWPWIAKVFIEGDYKCTGVLVDLSWVLVSDSCLWDASPTHQFISVVLGSHRTLNSVHGLYEQVYKVDVKKDLYRSRVILLHLKKSAEYSSMVKPMTVSSPIFESEQKTVCVAIGQDNNNNTVTVFLNETQKNCNLSNRCFVRQGKERICQDGMEYRRQWSGLISCHSEQGWYPAASFVDSRGECSLGDVIVATDIENLRHEIRYYSGKVLISDSIENTGNDICSGVRCSRGRCIHLRQMCDGVKHCEDGIDENENSCIIKDKICEHDGYHKGCECSLGQMKCRNGKCVSKELFRDGTDDCGDGTDEPIKTSCSDYLARVWPSRLCDGILHCHDKSDENPMFCKCFAKRTFKCERSDEVENCVAPDMVCDGVRDCPNGEDERTCIGLSAPEGNPYGTGQVIVRSHGVWHSKCFPTQNRTKSELEAICRELGFISGHAKEIKDVEKYLVNSHNNLALEPFSDVKLNNQTIIKMRNSNNPIAKAIFDEDLKDCFPVFIECL